MADHQNIMCEVEIQPDIQECVEIESIPVDISDTVETIVECGEPMISMQSLEGRDIILEAQEEIIDDSGDPLNIYDVPVPDASDLYVESSPGPGPGPSRKRSKTKNRGTASRRENELLLDAHVETKPRKWEQKQVQIKTMEGEFSVTMWASGASDGKFLYSQFSYLFPKRKFPSRPRALRSHVTHCPGTGFKAKMTDFPYILGFFHRTNKRYKPPPLPFLPYFVMAALFIMVEKMADQAIFAYFRRARFLNIFIQTSLIVIVIPCILNFKFN